MAGHVFSHELDPLSLYLVIDCLGTDEGITHTSKKENTLHNSKWCFICGKPHMTKYCLERVSKQV